VAEGVERAEQQKFLQDYNCCDAMQGYLFSPSLTFTNLIHQFGKPPHAVAVPATQLG